MDVITDQNWLLSVGTFLPLAGVLVMLFIPRGEEQLHKQIAIVTALATLAVGIYTLTQFDYDQAEKLQFFVDAEWIEVDPARTTRSASTASACRCTSCRCSSRCVVIIYTWDNMPEAGNPKAFLILMLVLQVGHGRHVHRPGPHPVLRLLRGRAAADVLHDRRVGRRAAPVRLAEVLPLHDVRLGADARRVPGAVLPDRRRELRASHYLDRGRAGARPRRRRSGSSPACSSGSPSRCRCSRSTPGCPTPTPRRRRRAR